MTFGSRFRWGAAARLAVAACCSLSLSLAALPPGPGPAQVLAQESGVAVSGAPAVPVPLTPEDGAVYPSWAETPPFAWQPVDGAGDYQVLINGGERTSPWLGRAKWSAGDLGDGTFTWQVLARSQGGISQPSPARTFTVSPGAAPQTGSDAAPEPAPEEDAAAAPDESPATSPAPAEPADAATVADAAPAADAEAPAATATLALDAAAPLVVGQPLMLTGAGFTPGETVTVRWLGDQGPVMGASTADDAGGFTFSLDVPSTPIGDRPVVAIGESDGKQAVAWYVIAPTLSVAPAAAAPGEPVTVSLSGFGPDEDWQVRWSGEDGEDGEVWQSGRTDANGAATIEAAAPDLPAGEHPLAGLGLTSGGRAAAALTLRDGAASEDEVAVLAEAPAEAAGQPSDPAPSPAPAAAGDDVGAPPDVTMNEGIIAAPPASDVQTTAAPDSTAGDGKPERDRKPAADPKQETRNEKKAEREANKVAIANEMRGNFGMPPIPEETPTPGSQSSGARGEEVSVEASDPPDAAIDPYLDPGADAPGSPAAAPVPPAAPADEIAAAQEAAPGDLAVPGAVYDLLPNPEALGIVERDRESRDRRESRGEDDGRPGERERGSGNANGNDRGNGRRDGDGAADEAAAPDDAAPATAPAAPAAPAPAPGTVLTFIPAADTSASAGAPADPQPEAQVTVLPLGGPDAATAYLTFDISGVGGGRVARATLTITGAVGFWGPVSVSAIPGYRADEGSLTWNGAPGGEIPATTGGGEPSAYPELPAGGVVSADVTGVIGGDGVITFVLRGTPDAGQAIGSRESDIPAVLEIVTG
ncbi:MAG: hypothetical protein ACKOWF_09015 [Chloroflexota bacterium]